MVRMILCTSARTCHKQYACSYVGSLRLLLQLAFNMLGDDSKGPGGVFALHGAAHLQFHLLHLLAYAFLYRYKLYLHLIMRPR
jgi:hypothetical protein